MGRLDLKRAAIIEDSDILKVEETAEGILAEVRERTAEMGLTIYPKPRELPEPLDTLDVSRLSNEELGIIHMRYTAYAAYTVSELAQYEVAYRTASIQLKRITAKLRTTLYAKEGVTKAEVPDLVKENSVYIKYEIESVKLFAMRETVESHYKAFSKSADAVSRIITIRGIDQRNEENGANIQNRKRSSTTRFGGARG